MKKLLILFLFIPILNYADLNKCENPVVFGNTIVCMPEVINMTECYNESIVNTYANLFKGSDDEEVLAFYVSNDEYENLYETFLENGLRQPYIKVYSIKQAKNVYLSNNDLTTLSNGIKSTFDEYQGSNVESMINSKASEFNMSFGKPILIEEYSINSKIKTFVALMSVSAGEQNVIMVAVMNLLNIKNRLVFFAYYDEYKGGMNQIEKTKSNSDYFALSLLANN